MHATAQLTHAPSIYQYSYAQNTLQHLANLHPEGEQDGPKLPDCSSGHTSRVFKKFEKICVARWDYAIHKSSFSALSYLAFSLSNSPHFASLAIFIFVVYIRSHINMCDKNSLNELHAKLHVHVRSTAVVAICAFSTLRFYF